MSHSDKKARSGASLEGFAIKELVRSISRAVALYFALQVAPEKTVALHIFARGLVLRRRAFAYLS